MNTKSKNNMKNEVILRYDSHSPVFKCGRCGKSQNAIIPARFAEFIKQGKAFTKSHKLCKEKKV